MPSRPLSADRQAVVKLQTRLDNEAIEVAKEPDGDAGRSGAAGAAGATVAAGSDR